ncbi:hypothetical protein ATY77_02980 [Rhizobium sp. R634]|uniref:hypothetical protein n=1 Tax=Rhizobium sp. R634 TaxID=1764274 RepID=UPI000B534E3E|nr:hypothetical protein [Rhizobium sp. R634]OWV82218.1 hypothetical protein ATY77_02980 [Rhizobium sp. R634]
MDRSRQSASIRLVSSGLNFADRQIALREIVDDIRSLRDRAPHGAFDRSPALDRLLQMITAAVIPIARADDEDWENILMELLDLRAAMARIGTGAAQAPH